MTCVRDLSLWVASVIFIILSVGAAANTYSIVKNKSSKSVAEPVLQTVLTGLMAALVVYFISALTS
jgi:VIT1/CCC1 family predicted Fe2+/Mn2+ transporter